MELWQFVKFVGFFYGSSLKGESDKDCRLYSWVSCSGNCIKEKEPCHGKCGGVEAGLKDICEGENELGKYCYQCDDDDDDDYDDDESTWAIFTVDL